MPVLCTAGGAYSLEKVKINDPLFAQHVMTGLLWQILSWKMEEEEPDAVSVIQAAMNAKNSLFLVTHEMQALSKLSSLTSAITESGIATKVAETCRQQLAETMPRFADDERFLGMLRFTVDLGSDSAPSSRT